MDNPTVVVDNDLMLFARDQLVMSLAKVSNRRYPSLKYDKLMPVVVLEGYEWENQFESLEFDHFGIAVVLADGANDGGKVGVVGRRQRYPIKTLSDYTEISWLFINQAKAKNIPIDSKYAAALIYGMERKYNDIAYNGETDYGLQGLFTSQIPRMNAATTLAGAASPQARIDILNNAVTTVLNNCQNVWTPRLIAMPNRQINLLGNEVYTTATGKTTLATFKQNQAELGYIDTILADDSLIGKGENGTDAMLILPGPTPNVGADVEAPTGDPVESGTDYPIYFAIAREFDIPHAFPPWTDQMYRERAISRVCGCVVEDPLSALIVSGI